MKKWNLLLAAVLVVSSTAQASEFVSNEIIVKYKSGTVRERSLMNRFYDAMSVKKVFRFTGSMEGFEKLTLSSNVKVQDAIAQALQNADIESAQPNYIVRIQPTNLAPAVDRPVPVFEGWPSRPGPGPRPTPTGRPAVEPAPAEVNPPVVDPNLSGLYGMEKIGATEAWNQETTRGSKQMIVAVIDTGVDYNHEDLSFNMWRNPNPTQNDVVGFDFVHNDGLPFDDHMHGTHTAGTVGAVGGNGKGVSGVMQKVSIMALKFLAAEGSGTTADAIRAIDYAINNGAKVLSNSWGGKGDEDNAALREAIERAKAKDVLFVAAAGNDSSDNDGRNPSFPAAFDNDNLISVAATDKNDKLANFSNYGKKTTHLAAPGVNTLSTAPGNTYKSISGTSMACPHVAGAAALVWSKNPSWNYKQVKDALLNSVDKLDALSSKTITGGRLNVMKALQ